MLSADQREKLEDSIRNRLADGRLPCSKAFEIAKTLGIPVRTVGDTCNRLGIRINRCQLGCFD